MRTVNVNYAANNFNYYQKGMGTRGILNRKQEQDYTDKISGSTAGNKTGAAGKRTSPELVAEMMKRAGLGAFSSKYALGNYLSGQYASGKYGSGNPYSDYRYSGKMTPQKAAALYEAKIMTAGLWGKGFTR